MSVLALIPARSGSKGVPHKNIVSFRGKPLLVHSIEHGLRARNVDRVLVSTDSPYYREIALKAGAEVPFLRPQGLAQDLSRDLEVFEHCLAWLERNEGYRPDLVVHLRPTYPTRRVADVEAVVELLARQPKADSVRSVAPAPHSPFKMWRKKEDGFLEPLIGGEGEPWNLPRQALPRVLIQNAAVDCVRARVIREEHSMTGRSVLPYVMDRFEDVDSWSELASLELLPPEGTLPEGRTFAFDMDGVLATLVADGDYTVARPNTPAVSLVKQLKAAGNRIVVYTARGGKTGRDWGETTKRQLQSWGVPHDELLFGKPPADYYVDDRMLSLATLEAWVRSCPQKTRS
jgi:CMP-N-acetylneuraminic acid synthetase